MKRASLWRGVHVLADDDPRWPVGPVAQARAACDGGARVVQLRVKHATDRVALAWAREIRMLTRAAGLGFVVNDRFDLALLCEADAVHLGQDDLPPEALPLRARAALAVGRSTHNLEQALAAVGECVDYVAFGPLFGTASKASPFAARGLDALREIVACSGGLPVVAIGGIDAGTIADVARSGAGGAAVISAAAAATDPVSAIAALQSAFEKAT